jgi:hypothetical protein
LIFQDSGRQLGKEKERKKLGLFFGRRKNVERGDKQVFSFEKKKKSLYRVRECEE